jgi:hypothetical protein
MCIIADSVKDVSKTNIAIFQVGYVMGNSNNPIPAQLVVYSAQVESEVDSNAFILPVYNPSNQVENIIPVDMTNGNLFFSEIKSLFGKWFPQRISNSWTNSRVAESALPVHKVGNYKFSIMPNKKDFERIDQTQLNIDPNAKVSIDVHSDNYSFIVYQFFKKGKIDIEPFGYVCPTNNSVFVPTIHGHPHNQTLGFATRPLNEFEQLASYDHTIYVLLKCLDNSKSLKLDQTDLKSLNNILKKITKDYRGQNIRILAPKCLIPKKLEIKTTATNRNLSVGSIGSEFIYDLTMDRH